MSLLCVEATLAAPVVTTDDIHFDGLLTSAHPRARSAAREGLIGRDTPLASIPYIPIPLQRATARGLTLPLASAAQWPEDAKLAAEHVVKRRDGWDVEALRGPIHLGLGPGKNRMLRLPVILARTVAWWAMGERREVLRLVQRITHIGSWRAAGFGLVSSWRVETCDPATIDPRRVLVHEGVAQRHLPAEWCAGAETLGVGPIEPPYWHPGRDRPAVARAGTRVTLIREIEESCYAAADPATNRRWKERRDAARESARARRHAGGAAQGGPGAAPD
jgi:hypothetical protein